MNSPLRVFKKFLMDSFGKKVMLGSNLETGRSFVTKRGPKSRFNANNTLILCLNLVSYAKWALVLSFWHPAWNRLYSWLCGISNWVQLPFFWYIKPLSKWISWQLLKAYKKNMGVSSKNGYFDVSSYLSSLSLILTY